MASKLFSITGFIVMLVFMQDLFADVIGHAKICDLLRRVVSHPGNGYLFNGPTQTGKKLIAEQFAKALLNHPAERTLESHPDFIRLHRDEEARDIAVRQIRELSQRVILSSGSGGRKVVLIEDADMLNEESANALLKMIEEPAHRTTYLLLAERAERLPATLRSRLAILSFQPVSAESISSWLRGTGATESQAREAALWSQGRPGLAKMILEGRKDWELKRQEAQKFVEILCNAPLGKQLAAIDEITQAIERGDRPDVDWRAFLQRCMEAQRGMLSSHPAAAVRVGNGLIHAWKMGGSSLSPRFALEWCLVRPTLDPRLLPSFLHTFV